MDLDELAGDERLRLPVGAAEGVVAHARGEHAAGREPQLEVFDHGRRRTRARPPRPQESGAGCRRRGPIL